MSALLDNTQHSPKIVDIRRGSTPPPQAADAISIAWMYKDLAKSGLVPEDLQAYPTQALLGTCGAYVIPFRHEKMWTTRYDRSTDKYIGPKGMSDVWWSHTQDLSTFRDHSTLYLIEGEKKAARFVKKWPGEVALGIRGCRGYSTKLDQNTSVLLPNIIECLRPNQTVVAIFDGDIETNTQIQQAALKLSILLQVYSVTLAVCRPPVGKGVDDWLQDDPDANLTDLVPFSLTEVETTRKNILLQAGVKVSIDGGFVLNENNAQKVLAVTLKDRLYTDMRLGVIYNGEVCKDMEPVYRDNVIFMQESIHAKFSRRNVEWGVDAVAGLYTRDLIKELIAATPWDGEARLNTWASDYFEGISPKYTREWGRLLMTGLGLRLHTPGTKVDYAFILIGAQGLGKSTFFEQLSSFEGTQFCYPLIDLSLQDGGRTLGTAVARAVVVDLAEGIIFDSRRASTEMVKQMITQVEDTWRPVYSKSMMVRPRGFIFGGTTNRTDYLMDASGSRRFLNLNVTSIKYLPYNIKLQILAEVFAKEQELTKTAWYNLNVDVEDLPADLREGNDHITNAHTIINQQFQRADSLMEEVYEILDGGKAARLKETDAMFISARHMAYEMGYSQELGKKNLIARCLSGMVNSQVCPYLVVPIKKRAQQIDIPPNLKDAYGTLDPMHMLAGYSVTKRHKRL